MSEKFKKFIIEELELIKRFLNFHNYTITVEFVDKISGYKHIFGGNITAEMELEDVYMEVVIYISKLEEEYYKDGDIQGVIEDLVHELVHVWITPIMNFTEKRLQPEYKKKDMELLDNLDENTTQRITKVICREYLKQRNG